VNIEESGITEEVCKFFVIFLIIQGDFKDSAAVDLLDPASL